MAITERLALLIDAKAGGAISELNKLNAEINMVNRTQTQATGVTGMFQRGLEKVGIQSNATGELMKAGLVAGATAAGYAMLRFGQDSVRATVNFADGIRSIQQSTGLSATAASRLNAVLDDFGISAEKGSSSLGKLARNLYDNKGALDQYGVSVATNRDGSINMEKTLINVANAYQNIKDPAARSALVVDAFGKSGKDLIPILDGGGRALREMFANVPDAQIFDQGQIDNALQYKLAADNLKDSFEEIKFTLGNELIPALTSTFNAFADVSRAAQKATGYLKNFEIGSTDLFSILKNSFLSAGNPFQPLLDGLKMLGGGNDKARDSASSHARQQQELAQKTLEVSAAAKAENDELQKNIDLIYKRINATLGVEGAQINLAETMAKTNGVLADGESTELQRQKAILDSKKAIDQLVESVKAEAQANGDAKGNVQGQIDTLNFLKGTLDPSSPLISFIDQYIYKLGAIPRDISSNVQLNYVTRWTDPDTPPPFDWPGGADGNPETPYPMAKGGIVTRPTNALIGEAGPEAVIPLGRGTGMGTTINLTLDGRIISQIVRDDLIRIGRANGSALGKYA